MTSRPGPRAAPRPSALLRTLSLPAGVPPPGAALLAELRDVHPVRARRPWATFVAVAGVSLLHAALLLGWPAAWIWGRALRADLDGLPAVWLIVVALSWAAAFGLILATALLPPRGQVAPRPRRARRATIAASFALVGLALSWSAEVPGRSLLAADGATFASVLLQCVLAALVVGAVPAGLGIVALRRAVPDGACWVAGALGAAGGALGGLALHFHCPWAGAWHVALAHGGPVVLGALLAGALGRRWLRP